MHLSAAFSSWFNLLTFLNAAIVFTVLEQYKETFKHNENRRKASLAEILTFLFVQKTIRTL